VTDLDLLVSSAAAGLGKFDSEVAVDVSAPVPSSQTLTTLGTIDAS
jgi:hypothetical protein